MRPRAGRPPAGSRRRNGTAQPFPDSNDAALRTNPQPTSPAKPEDDTIAILMVDDTPDKLLALEAAISDLGETIVKAAQAPAISC